MSRWLKKAAAVLLAVCLAAVWGMPAAADVLQEGDGWYFDYDFGTGKGTLTVTSNAGMTDDLAAWKALASEIVIGKDVTKIPYNAFPGFQKLTAFTVEEGNTAFSAEDGVLYNAEKTTLYVYSGGLSAETFIVPDSVKTINMHAFGENTVLKTVQMSAVETIEDYAFEKCTALTTVTLSDCLKLIADSAFSGCKNLTEIALPQTLETIRTYAFSGCSALSSIAIPASVKQMGAGVFAGCIALSRVTFEGTEPPINFSDLFVSCSGDLQISVPVGSEEAYIAALGEGYRDRINPELQPTKYSLFVNGVQFSEEVLTVTCGDGTAVFSPEENTLTLTNATISHAGGLYGYGGAINSGLPQLTIVLHGDIIIDANGEDGINSETNCSITVTGEGALTITSPHPIDMGRSDQSYSGSETEGDLTVKDVALTTVGGGIWVSHDITFENATVTAAGAIFANHASTVTVTNSTVATNAIYFGNDLPDDMRFVLDGGTVTLSNGGIYFMPAGNGSVAIESGKLDITTEEQAINCPADNITFGDGVAVVEGDLSENGRLVIDAVQETKIGDMDGNGTINMADAFFLYRAASGQITLTAEQEAVADMDGDGTINMADAFALYRLASGS